MKVENPIYKEVSFEKTVEDGITVFRQVLDPNIPRDDAFFEDGQFSDKLCMMYEGPWPCGDFMPVKNYKIPDTSEKFKNVLGRVPTCAFMIRGDLATIYDREENVLFQYKDIDELLAAGWVVD